MEWNSLGNLGPQGVLINKLPFRAGYTSIWQWKDPVFLDYEYGETFSPTFVNTWETIWFWQEPIKKVREQATCTLSFHCLNKMGFHCFGPVVILTLPAPSLSISWTCGGSPSFFKRVSFSKQNTTFLLVMSLFIPNLCCASYRAEWIPYIILNPYSNSPQ